MSFFNIFLDRFASKHGAQYNYAKSIYRGALEKIEIVCHQHGSFFQSPVNHAGGSGCPECAKTARAITRRKNNPLISTEERQERRKEANARYEAKEDVKRKNAERRRQRKESGEAQSYHRDWYVKNRDKVIRRAKEWSDKNPSARRDISKRYKIGRWNDEGVYVRTQISTPSWADLSAIDAIYAECERITKDTGIQHHVDHIEPLRAADRCGLHVANNLQILTASDNLKKGNSGIAPKRKEFLDALSSADKDNYVQTLFSECRASGFPYYEVPSVETARKSVSTSRAYLNSRPDDHELIATAHGNSIASSFFPHLFSVPMVGKASPDDVFFNDDLLKKALTTMIHRHDHVSDRTIRTAVSLYGGARAVSNFPPMIAAKLYRKYAGDNATVYDPCGGWGGRMFGAAIAQNVKHYICTEVSSLSITGLNQLAEMLNPFVKSDVFGIPAEDFSILSNVDMVMTSPPYFSHEQYSSDAMQSYLRYDSTESWNNGFLSPMIKNAFAMLKGGGVLALNVADVPLHPTLTADTMRLALSAGFDYEDTLKIFIRTTNGKQRAKFEPVFIFRK